MKNNEACRKETLKDHADPTNLYYKDRFMTNITKILTRTNCASNHSATGVYQADVLSDRYRVRVDPATDKFCIIDREYIKYQMTAKSFWNQLRQSDWHVSIQTIVIGKEISLWQSFDDALAFAKLLDKEV